MKKLGNCRVFAICGAEGQFFSRIDLPTGANQLAEKKSPLEDYNDDLRQLSGDLDKEIAEAIQEGRIVAICPNKFPGKVTLVIQTGETTGPREASDPPVLTAWELD